MLMIPTQVLSLWFGGLFSFALIGGGAYLAYRWYEDAWRLDPLLDRWVFDPDLGWNAQTAFLAAAIALLAWAFLGGLIGRLLSGAGKAPGGKAGREPEPVTPRQVRRLKRPDGSELHVELHGPEDAPAIVLTHGWGANADEWRDLVRDLSGRFRLIAWDLPGLGRSTRPTNRDYSLENLAGHLRAVAELAGDRPVVLAGHSIGGMITLTYCKQFPADLGPRVAGLVLAETTHTNPVRTTKNAALYTALEKPVLVPLLWLMIGLSPLVRLMLWTTYLNGSAHRSTRRDGFAEGGKWGRIDWVTRFQLQAPPAVLARGMFGMLRYDATGVLPGIGIPTLVVPGDLDTVCLPEASERIAREAPGARLEPLAPAKHMALIEHPDRFSAQVAAFADACLEPGEALAGPAHQRTGR